MQRIVAAGQDRVFNNRFFFLFEAEHSAAKVLKQDKIAATVAGCYRRVFFLLFG